MASISFRLEDADATEQLGRVLADRVRAPSTIYLEGHLGAGKTTLVRGFLRGLGHSGSIKSPTYTLVEPYDIRDGECLLSAYHFDLYRLSDPEELEFIGIREYQEQDSILLFEWPEKGEGMIPKADWLIHLEYDHEQRIVSLSHDDESLLQDLAQ